jgi:hypothetical protein
MALQASGLCDDIPLSHGRLGILDILFGLKLFDPTLAT